MEKKDRKENEAQMAWVDIFTYYLLCIVCVVINSQFYTPLYNT